MSSGKKGSMSEIPSDPAGVAKVSWLEDIFSYLYQFRRDGNMLSVNLPDTIVFKYQRPGAWFYSETMDRRPELMKKEKLKDLTAQEIFLGFTKKHPKVSTTDIVAYHVAFKPSDSHPRGSSKVSSQGIAIEYFDEEGLEHFLFKRHKENNGILQLFIDPGSDKNTMVYANWTPHHVKLETRSNKNTLDAAGSTILERAVTFDGPEHASMRFDIQNRSSRKRIGRVLDEIIKHINALLPKNHHVSNLELYLKMDYRNQPWVLFCSSLRVTPTQKVTIGKDGKRVMPQLDPLATAPLVSGPFVAKVGVVLNTFECPSCGYKSSGSGNYEVTMRAAMVYYRRRGQLMLQSEGGGVDLQGGGSDADSNGRSPSPSPTKQRPGTKAGGGDNPGEIKQRRGKRRGGPGSKRHLQLQRTFKLDLSESEGEEFDELDKYRLSSLERWLRRRLLGTRRGKSGLFRVLEVALDPTINPRNIDIDGIFELMSNNKDIPSILIQVCEDCCLAFNQSVLEARCGMRGSMAKSDAESNLDATGRRDPAMAANSLNIYSVESIEETPIRPVLLDQPPSKRAGSSLSLHAKPQPSLPPRARSSTPSSAFSNRGKRVSPPESPVPDRVKDSREGRQQNLISSLNDILAKASYGGGGDAKVVHVGGVSIFPHARSFKTSSNAASPMTQLADLRRYAATAPGKVQSLPAAGRRDSQSRSLNNTFSEFSSVKNVWDESSGIGKRSNVDLIPPMLSESRISNWGGESELMRESPLTKPSRNPITSRLGAGGRSEQISAQYGVGASAIDPRQKSFHRSSSLSESLFVE